MAIFTYNIVFLLLLTSSNIALVLFSSYFSPYYFHSSHFHSSHFNSLHFNSLHFNSSHFNSSHFHFVTLQFITLQFITLQFITLQFIILQFMTFPFISLCSSVGLMMDIDPPDGAIKQPNHTVGDGGQEMSLVFF